MGISPQIWGKDAWRFIHYVALAYPHTPSDSDKKDYLVFLKSLEKVLPCPACAYNFSEKMKIYPPKLNSPKEFFEWTVDMHNEVNKDNGKPVLSYEKAYKELGSKKVFDASFLPYIIPPAILLSLMIYSIKKNG